MFVYGLLNLIAMHHAPDRKKETVRNWFQKFYSCDESFEDVEETFAY